MKKNKCLSNSIALLFLITCIFCCLQLSAQNEISDSLVRERMQSIQKTLGQNKVNTQRWWYGWLAGYSAATIVQSTVGILSDTKKNKQDMFLGAITTSLGIIGQFTTPVVPGVATDTFANFSGDNPGYLLVQLKCAEDLLQKAAFAEKEARSWKTHAVCGVVNLSSGLITWLGFKRTVWAGVANFAINTVVCEVQIWSTPSRALKDYRNYCRKYKPGEKLHAGKSDLKWSAGVSAGTIQVILEF